MSQQQITFSTSDGGAVTVTLFAPAMPDAPARIETGGAVSLPGHRALERDGPAQRARQRGEAEYASWFEDRAGEVEYASWFAQRKR